MVSSFIHYLQLHPAWGVVFASLIIFAESLPLIGGIIPGTVIVPAIGVIVGAGILPAVPTIICSFFSAVLGDTFSFSIGHLIDEKIYRIWPFKKYPGWIDKGRKFFKHYGAQSIVVGRFVGPMRSNVPFIAGVLQMRWRIFLLAAIPSAFLWLIGYLVPGILIGTYFKSDQPLDHLHSIERTILYLTLIIVVLLVLQLLYIKFKKSKLYLKIRHILQSPVSLVLFGSTRWHGLSCRLFLQFCFHLIMMILFFCLYRSINEFFYGLDDSISKLLLILPWLNILAQLSVLLLTLSAVVGFVAVNMLLLLGLDVRKNVLIFSLYLLLSFLLYILIGCLFQSGFYVNWIVVSPGLIVIWMVGLSCLAQVYCDLSKGPGPFYILFKTSFIVFRVLLFLISFSFILLNLSVGALMLLSLWLGWVLLEVVRLLPFKACCTLSLNKRLFSVVSMWLSILLPWLFLIFYA